ncbi:MAG: formimidoylglutamase [Ignavibacteria bacterium]|nr:formimidoylglutamase [Ignavibacteria bacterium]
MGSDSFLKTLQPPDQSLIFRSHDQDDLRIGDILRYESDVPSGTKCVFVIIGVPQHIGVERNGGRPGAAFAPAAFRRAFSKLAISSFEQLVRNEELVVADAGDIVTDGKTLEQIHDEQYDVVTQVLAHGYVPIIVGGGHDTAWPTIRAMETIGTPYGVVNIDAHADVRPLKDGRSHSGSPFYQMLSQQQSNLLPGSFVEFGLQHSVVARAHLDFLKESGAHVWMLDDIRASGLTGSWEGAWQVVSRAESAYVSLDIDAIASGYAPGASAPAADGFAPHEVSQILRRAASSGKLRAFDVVEVNPTLDQDNRTSKLAATLVHDLIMGFAQRLM